MTARRERGSVLLLVPAGVLIVLVLACIAVDYGVAFLGEREVASLATAAANNAATAAVDEDHLRETGEFRLDPSRVDEVVEATIAASSTKAELGAPVVEIVDVGGEPGVRVRLTGHVDYVFSPAFPGAPDGIDVDASAVAVARLGG